MIAPSLLIVLCCGATASVQAQSINIDIGIPGTEPPRSYRAAGMPGHWQKFEATTWGEFHDLVDIHGNPIGARGGRCRSLRRGAG